MCEILFCQIKLTVVTFITKPEIIYLLDLEGYHVFFFQSYFCPLDVVAVVFFLKRNAQIRKEARKKIEFPFCL